MLSISSISVYGLFVFFFQAEDGIRDYKVTGVQTCALPISGLLVGLERRPEVPHPLPLLVEAVGGLGAGADVVREAGVAAAERGVILGQMRDQIGRASCRERV